MPLGQNHKDMTVDELTKKIGTRIQYFRKLQGLTQEELAQLGGFPSASRVSDYERGGYRIGLEVLLRFANALNIKMYELFLFEGKKEIERDLISREALLKRLSGIEEQLKGSITEVQNVQHSLHRLRKDL